MYFIWRSISCVKMNPQHSPRYICHHNDGPRYLSAVRYSGEITGNPVREHAAPNIWTFRWKLWKHSIELNWLTPFPIKSKVIFASWRVKIRVNACAGFEFKLSNYVLYIIDAEIPVASNRKSIFSWNVHITSLSDISHVSCITICKNFPPIIDRCDWFSTRYCITVIPSIVSSARVNAVRFGIYNSYNSYVPERYNT